RVGQQGRDGAEDLADDEAAVAHDRRHTPRRPGARFAIGKRELARHHADDRVRALVEYQRLAEGLCAPAEVFLPKAIREDDDAGPIALALTLGAEPSDTEPRVQEDKKQQRGA